SQSRTVVGHGSLARDPVGIDSGRAETEREAAYVLVSRPASGWMGKPSSCLVQRVAYYSTRAHMVHLIRCRVVALWLWRPAWAACSWVLGLSAFALLQMLHFTCRLQVEGIEHPDARRGVIHTFWHDAWFLWLVAFPRSQRDRAWLIHPAAYMQP